MEDCSEAMDLFGDIDDISSESDDDSQLLIPGQRVDVRRLPQGQQEEVPISETRIEVEIPHFNPDLGNELYFVKLPKFLSIEPKPFDPQCYEDEFTDEKVLDEEERTRLKIKVENTIRWRARQDKKGNEIKESNARIVKWSDGSLSLHLGSEVFDVYKAPLQGNHNHLFVREDTGLQGQAIFKCKLTFRPHSTDYATRKKMTLPLANRYSRTQKIRILPIVGRDPECQRTEKIKKEGQRLRASAHQGTIHLREKQKQQRPSVPCQESSSDEDDDEEEEKEEEEDKEECDEAIKNQHCGELGEEPGRVYSSISDAGSEEETAQELVRTKQLTGDEEMNFPETGKQGAKRKRMAEV